MFISCIQWDLVCTDNPAAELGQSILQIGGMVGAFLFGMLADHYGRRPALFSAVILYNICGLTTSFSPGFTFFLVLRFIGGIAHMVSSCKIVLSLLKLLSGGKSCFSYHTKDKSAISCYSPHCLSSFLIYRNTSPRSYTYPHYGIFSYT